MLAVWMLACFDELLARFSEAGFVAPKLVESDSHDLTGGNLTEEG
jgi:hypothetical protein